MVINVVRRGKLIPDVWNSSTIEQTLIDIMSKITVEQDVRSIMVVSQESDSVPLMVTMDNKVVSGKFYGVTFSVRSICHTRNPVKQLIRVVAIITMDGQISKQFRMRRMPMRK